MQKGYSTENKKYIPIQLAHLTFDSINGTDETLPPIVLLHGLITTKEIWKNIAQKFADSTRRKVYAYDGRCSGDSQYTDEFNFGLATQDLYHFLDSQRIPKAILIGHSMGGYTVSRLALKSPERVEMAVLVDINIAQFKQKSLDATLVHAQLWENAIQKVSPNVSREEATRQLVDEVYKQIPPHKLMYYSPKEAINKCDFNLKQNNSGSYAMKWNFDAYLNSAKDIDSFSQPPQGIYHGPSLFIYGALSPFKINNEEEIQKHFPKAELVEIKNATHNVHIDQPEILTEIILKFIFRNQLPPNHL